MDHSVLVGVLESEGRFPGNAERVFERQLPFASQSMSEAFAFHEGHGEPELARSFSGIVDRQDMRVLEPCGEADLSLEPVGSETGCEFRMQDFESDRPVVLEIMREEHRGHPAAPKLTPERVVACQAAFEESSKVWHPIPATGD